MKNAILVLTITLLSCTFLKSQIAFYDAQLLKESIIEEDDGFKYWKDSSSIGIWEHYMGEIEGNDSRDVYYKKRFENNPFLDSYRIDYSETQASTKYGKLSDIASSISGLNVTNVADGIALFLVERTKQELSLLFFDNFIEFVNKPETEDFRILFPNSVNVLNAIGDQIYMLPNYLNTLRESFDKDLQNILLRIPDIIDKRIPLPEREFFSIALSVIEQLKGGVHPGIIIEKLSQREYPEELNDLENSIKIIATISNSLRSKGSENFWISSEDLQEINDPSTLNIYMGLLYEQLSKLHFNGETWKEHFSSATNKIVSAEEIFAFISDVCQKTEAMNLALTSLKSKQADDLKINTFNSFFDASVNLLKLTQDVKDLFPEFKTSNSLNNLINISEVLSNLYIDINERRYNSAIIDLHTFLEIVLKDNYTWKNEFIRYGTFIANIAEAESSEDVKNAIENVALPVGSASIKRTAKFNVALNAYVGGHVGFENFIEDIEGQEKSNLVFGLTAPVGISFSWGLASSKRNCGSLSTYLSLIDVGGITSFRFQNDSVNQLPDIKLENIIAPGAYLIYGFPKAPVSIGGGWQYGPQLRGITATESGVESIINASAYRWSIFVAVDIPIVNFYTKLRE